jgi:predicted DNA-binding transcriptional regulator YafY
MNRFDRIYKIHELLRHARRPVPMSKFMALLESSRNSVTRDFEYMRNVLGAPLEYCRDQNGHRYDPDAPVFELPGFWMNAGELYALLACEQLLEQVQPGLMATQLAPLRERVRSVLSESGHDAALLSDKIRIQPIHVRSTTESQFFPVAEATLSGCQLQFEYDPRGNSSPGLRLTHPQRLVHYRSNWYLLAWCDRANGLRLFSIDRIQSPQILSSSCRQVPPEELDNALSGGFGIFGGDRIQTAHLRFSAYAARWVADELWHDDQLGEWQSDGYHLTLPFTDMPELIMDILRHGEHVEVVSPPELRTAVAEKIKKMQEIYW